MGTDSIHSKTKKDKDRYTVVSILRQNVLRREQKASILDYLTRIV